MDEQTKALIKEAAREAATEAVEDVLTRLGFDVDDPTAAQADMHAVRRWRYAQKQAATMTIRATIGLLVTGTAALVILGIKTKFFGG